MNSVLITFDKSFFNLVYFPRGELKFWRHIESVELSIVISSVASPDLFVAAFVNKELLFFNQEMVLIVWEVLHLHLILEHWLWIFVHVQVKHETKVTDKWTEVDS